MINFLFVFVKYIKWEWLEIYGEDKFVVMFGGLYIDMVVFKLFGDLLKGSGWVIVLFEVDVVFFGIVKFFLIVFYFVKIR